MSKTTTTARPLTGPQLAEQILEQAGHPMHAKIIAEKVIAADRARKPADRTLRGKTPAETIMAMLNVSHVKGATFQRVSPGVFGLRVWTAAKLSKAPEMPDGLRGASAPAAKSKSKPAKSSPAPAPARRTPGKASPAAPARKRSGKAPTGVDPNVAAHSTIVAEGKAPAVKAERKAPAALAEALA